MIVTLLFVTALSAPSHHQMTTLSKGHQKKLQRAIAMAEAALKSEDCQQQLDVLIPPSRVYPWIAFYEELRDKEACKSVHARARPGGDQVWLCKGFWRLGDTGRAAVLVHEWSHLAGTGRDHNQINPIIYQLGIERNCFGRGKPKWWAFLFLAL